MKEDPVVFIKELSEQDRPFMLNHFLGLSPADRRLRFGAALPDEAVTKYVNAIDFNRDTIFGVYESTFNLVGVGHLAFPLPENLPPSEDVQPNRVAEFGVSVSAPMRRKNVGTKLFDRAAIHCRNKHINTLYIHCLASNRPMICIAGHGQHPAGKCGGKGRHTGLRPEWQNEGSGEVDQEDHLTGKA